MPPVEPGFRPITRRPYRAPLLRGVDGDTTNSDQAVRMVSVDTPESKLGGAPATARQALDRCRQASPAGRRRFLMCQEVGSASVVDGGGQVYADRPPGKR
jgi:endonuclease YncB( thermonuclease family)